MRKISARISPNLPEKNLGHFLCEHILKPTFFWDDLQKEYWAPFLSSFSGMLRRFSKILPGFSPNQNIWGSACTPCTPASYTTASRDELLSSGSDDNSTDSIPQSGQKLYTANCSRVIADHNFKSHDRPLFSSVLVSLAAPGFRRFCRPAPYSRSSAAMLRWTASPFKIFL